MLASMNAHHLSRAGLLAQGHTRRSIHAAVRRGELIHVRRDRYLTPDVDDRMVRAVRVGGRLTCLSLLELGGVFVLRNQHLDVQVTPGASRLRSPHDRRTRATAPRRRGVKLHWTEATDIPASACAVGIVDALVHAVLCQPPRAAIATLDSALHIGVIAEDQLADVFARLPARFQVLRELLDGRAESGPESLVRLVARQLGCDVRLQVRFDDIGRVDLVLDGWLVVECDSKEFHADWETQVKDRERDLALAALGYCTFRVTAAAIMYRPDEVFAALRGLIRSRREA